MTLSGEMRSIGLYLVVGFVAFLLQLLLSIVFAGPEALPNLYVVLLVFLGFYQPNPKGALISFLIGVEFDLFQPYGLIGPHSAAGMLVFAFVAIVSGRLFVKSLLTVALTVFVGALVFSVGYLLLLSQFTELHEELTSYLGRMLWEAGLTAILAPGCFALLRPLFDNDRSGSALRRYEWGR